jgi:hypothetical protein
MLIDSWTTATAPAARSISAFGAPAPGLWRDRFMAQASLLAPDLSAETLDALASLWAFKRLPMSPEEAAQFALLSVSGDIDI